ncbi:MAG: hypothetical protein ABEJ03_03405 [Candidatus Nanohaloarchaea archaeon]
MRKFTLAVLVVALASAGASQSIGVSPATVDLGTVERGQEVGFSLYVSSTGTTEPYRLNVTVLDPMSSDRYEPGGRINPTEYSGEEIQSWIEFSQPIYDVDPGDTTSYETGSGTVDAEKRINVTLDVPSDAEPGYHTAQIGLSPNFGAEGSGFGTSLVGITRPRLIFRVPGKVTRSVQLSSVEAVRTREEKAQIVSTFRNTGSVTVNFGGGLVDVYDSEDRKVGVIDIPTGVRIPPGETRRIESIWAGEGVEGGTYTLDGTVDYNTGSTFVGESFAIAGAPRDPIEVQDPEDQDTQDGDQRSGLSPLMIIVAMAALGSVLYAFGIRLYYVMTATGAVGIATFIIFGGVNMVVLILAVFGLGLMLYMKW